MISLSEIEQQINQQSLPPVEKWNPSVCGEIDIKIDSNGRWYHEGSEIKRPELVKLFSSVLITENNEYFLITPVEKVRIQVELTPFVFSQVQTVEESLVFEDLFENKVILKDLSQWSFIQLGQDHWVPQIQLRGNLWGALSRQLFFQLVNQLQDDEALMIQSSGKMFPLSPE